MHKYIHVWFGVMVGRRRKEEGLRGLEYIIGRSSQPSLPPSPRAML